MQRVAGIIVLACAAIVTAAAQQGVEPPPVIFRSEVNYVEVDASVTNAAGEIVNDLTERDFEVLEDGRAQKLATFSSVVLPIERAAPSLFAGRPIEPDVRTNRAIEGRIYLIVLDDLHTAFERSPRVKAAARRFVEQAVGLTDVAAIVFTGRNDASQDFTSNQRLLLEAVDRFSGRKLRSAAMAQLDGVTEQMIGTPQSVQPVAQTVIGADIDKDERAFRARSAMASIRKLSEFLAGIRGRRKAMLLFGEGVDYDIDQAMGTAGATASIVIEDIRSAIAAAQRGNVAVYTIDPRGLFDSADAFVETAFVLHDENPGASSRQAVDARAQGRRIADTHVDETSLRSEVRIAQESLRAIALDTGGFSVLNTNEFASAFDRIIQENSSYYLLGYYPSNDKRDGRLRRVDVKVKRPGLTVRARSGYVAAKRKPAAAAPAADSASRHLIEALGSPLPVSDVQMTVFVAAFKGTAPHTTIAYALEIDASQFAFTERAGVWTDQIEVIHTAATPDGKLTPGERQRLNLALDAETYARVKSGGLRVIGQIDLLPGRYQLRFAAGDGSGRAGNVLYDADVPDFTQDALTISSVALTSQQSANAMGTVRPKNLLTDYLPGPPVATRQFHQGDRLSLFAEVYENLVSSQSHQVVIRTQLRDLTGAVVAQATESRASADLRGPSGGYGVSADLSLAGIPPGLYFLHLDAQVQTAGLPTVTKNVQLRVIR
jgi:VWFA-related protein